MRQARGLAHMTAVIQGITERWAPEPMGTISVMSPKWSPRKVHKPTGDEQ